MPLLGRRHKVVIICAGACSFLLPMMADSLANPPIPPRRPVEPTQAAPHSESPPRPPTDGATAPKSHPEDDAARESGCVTQLQAVGLIADPVSTPAAPNEAYKIEVPVRLESLAVQGTEHPITFPDNPIVACVFAERFGKWVGALAQPLVTASLGTPIKAIRTGPGFACRNRAGGGSLARMREASRSTLPALSFMAAALWPSPKRRISARWSCSPPCGPRRAAGLRQVWGPVQMLRMQPIGIWISFNTDRVTAIESASNLISHPFGFAGSKTPSQVPGAQDQLTPEPVHTPANSDAPRISTKAAASSSTPAMTLTP